MTATADPAGAARRLIDAAARGDTEALRETIAPDVRAHSPTPRAASTR